MKLKNYTLDHEKKLIVVEKVSVDHAAGVADRPETDVGM